MTEMPRRVRSHGLESEARRRFRDLAEDRGWVVREIDRPDYGLDDWVEVFEGDDATGITFLVQSRGTDAETPDALRVPLRREQQNYFSAFNDPVLVVRYHSPTGRMFAKWFHQADPYPRLERSSMTLSAKDELTPGGVDMLAAEVRRFRGFRAAQLEWPVSLVVLSDEMETRELGLAIGGVLKNSPGLIRVVGAADAAGSYMTARLSHDQLVVDAGLASYTVHGSILDYPLQDLAAGIVLAAAEVLDNLGHGNRAADLIEASLLTKGAPAEVLDAVGHRLGRARRLDVALRVAQDWSAQEALAHRVAAVLLIGAAASQASRGAVRDVGAGADLLEQLAEQAESAAASDPLASTAYLTAARMRFAIGDWTSADTDFRRAVECGLGSTTRDDLLVEVAGAAHEAEDYERAVEIYTDLVDRGVRARDLSGRLADSLTRLGRFEAAMERFNAYLAEPGLVSTIWLITREVVSFLGASGYGDTERDAATATARLAARVPNETDEQLVERCLFAAEADPLFEPAWRELGTHQLDQQRYGLAYGPLMLAAIVTRSPEAWARLFVAAHHGRNQALAEAAVHMGAGDYGDEFHVAVRNEAGAAGEDLRSIAEAADDIDRASGRWRRGDPAPGKA